MKAELIVGLGLGMLSISITQSHGQAEERVTLFLNHKGNDFVGQEVVEDLREQILRSSQYTLVTARKDAVAEVSFLSTNLPCDATRASSVIATVVIALPESEEQFQNAFITFAERGRTASGARRIVEGLEAPSVLLFLRATQRLQKRGGQR
jgi:hypothetical protein